MNELSVPSAADLVQFLKDSEAKQLKGLMWAKVVYRPLICPFEKILGLIPPGARVFDVGCGAGTFLRLVAKFRSPAALGGIEIADHLVATGQKLMQECAVPVRFERYDGVRIPEWVADFDHVVLLDVLHHVPPANQVSFLSELWRRMRPGTRFIVKDIDAARRILVQFNRLHDFIVSREIGNELPAESVRASLENIGFSTSPIVRERRLCYPHFTIVALRS